MRNAVAEAAHVTLASGTARIRRRTIADPPDQRLAGWLPEEEGVVDFAAHRSQVATPSFPALERWVERHRRWFGDDGAGQGEQPSTIVYAGPRVYCGSDESGWYAPADEAGDPGLPLRWPRDPAWIVDALRLADESVPRGDGEVRGVPCARHGFLLDAPRHAVLWVGHAGAGGVRPIAGDAWIDADRRLRWVAWRELSRRSRWSRRRTWNTVELWDFGGPDPVALPAVPSRR